MVLTLRSKLVWLAVGGFAAIAVAALVTRRSQISALQAELVRDQAAARHAQALRAENARLREGPVPGSNREASTARLNQARAELVGVQNDLASVTHAIAEATDTHIEPFAAGSIVPAADWKNVGNATPQAALQTLLWAGAGGNVAALASSLRLETPQARAAAEALLAALPATERDKYGSPEQLMAELTVPDIPIASVKIRSWDKVSADGDQVMVQLELFKTADPKLATLRFARENDQWRLIVPQEVVNHYANRLHPAG